ncbi:hypothetical protein CKO_01170 [Citrobacter koseri ATCC BAA-895]|uniref:Uncharacterized protein n=1 Tax=Citrobacter koseri (strain ATCC BAA-895 / CDC 4225-83 / SGSC4696) TaxID=290338 RepID=A8AFP9_CITK8|nr:hypothetical protein CKO_01170 [Citrobacter koseri ATCC BAA-895]
MLLWITTSDQRSSASIRMIVINHSSLTFRSTRQDCHNVALPSPLQLA